MNKINYFILLIFLIFSGSLACGHKTNATDNTTTLEQFGVASLGLALLVNNYIPEDGDPNPLPCFENNGTSGFDQVTGIATFTDCDFGEMVLDGTATLGSQSVLTFNNVTVTPDYGDPFILSGTVNFGAEGDLIVFAIDLLATSSTSSSLATTIDGSVTSTMVMIQSGNVGILNDNTSLGTCEFPETSIESVQSCADISEICGFDPDVICVP